MEYTSGSKLDLNDPVDLYAVWSHTHKAEYGCYHSHTSSCYTTATIHTHSTANGCYRTDTIHTHSTANGCYTTVTIHTHTSSCYSNSRETVSAGSCTSRYGHDNIPSSLGTSNYYCSKCGKLLSRYVSTLTCTKATTREDLTCTKATTQTVLICTKATTENRLICGKTVGQLDCNISQ